MRKKLTREEVNKAAEQLAKTLYDEVLHLAKEYGIPPGVETKKLVESAAQMIETYAGSKSARRFSRRLDKIQREWLRSDVVGAPDVEHARR